MGHSDAGFSIAGSECGGEAGDGARGCITPHPQSFSQWARGGRAGGSGVCAAVGAGDDYGARDSSAGRAGGGKCILEFVCRDIVQLTLIRYAVTMTTFTIGKAEQGA